MNEIKTYFIEYKGYSYVGHCQIGAVSEKQAIDIFKQRFNGCFICSIETVEDIAERISETLMNNIRKQLA